jgi:hypothetical protein
MRQILSENPVVSSLSRIWSS